MTGEYYYNDLDSRDMARRGYDYNDEGLDDSLIAVWEDDSPAHRAWLRADQGDLDTALSYFEGSDDAYASLEDFDDLDVLFEA